MTVRLILIGGFLGAGKTTTLIRTARKFQKRGKKVAIVTNDQGKELIDTALARANDIDAKEVTGGCFCCRFDDLYNHLASLVKENQPEVIISEAVGSCTDLAATVIQPLKQFYMDEFTTAPLTIVVDPARLLTELGESNIPKFSTSISYIFEKQLSEADIIALNKVDRFSDGEIKKLTKYLQDRFPQATVQPISAEHGDHIDELLGHWETTSIGGEKILDIDYERYAEGEAQLAWMNILGDLSHTENKPIDPKAWTDQFLSKLNEHFIRERLAIAHLKVQINNNQGFVKASLVQTGDKPNYTVKEMAPSSKYRIVINVRIESSPGMLNLAVADALETVNRQFGAVWKATYHECFSPLPPKPTHRLEVLS